MTIPNVPFPCLQRIADQLRYFHAIVHFTTPTEGTVTHVSGKLSFEHHTAEEVLTVVILENPGHFPYLLLKGGIKQLVEEAVEDYHKEATTA